MRYFIAIICPPLAVLLCWKPIQFLLNLVLTLCFYVPGLIHALIVVGSHKADSRNKKLLRAIDYQTSVLAASHRANRPRTNVNIQMIQPPEQPITIAPPIQTAPQIQVQAPPICIDTPPAKPPVAIKPPVAKKKRLECPSCKARIKPPRLPGKYRCPKCTAQFKVSEETVRRLSGL